MLEAVAAPPPFNSPALAHVTSWIGNTYPGAKRWVQQNIRAMAVTEDGTVFTNIEWEEGGGNVGEYRDGALVRYAMHTVPDPRAAIAEALRGPGRAVAAGSIYFVGPMRARLLESGAVPI